MSERFGFEPIQILFDEIRAEDVGELLPGSDRYNVPIPLSAIPTDAWAYAFADDLESPYPPHIQVTCDHDRLIVQETKLKTVLSSRSRLERAAERANDYCASLKEEERQKLEKQRQEAEAEQQRQARHREHVAAVLKEERRKGTDS